MEGEKKQILSFWQDKRLRAICYRLTGAHYGIAVAGCTLPAGLPIGTGLYPDWRTALKTTDVVLLPLPTLRGDRVAFSEEEIPFSEFLSYLKRGTVLLTGMLPPDRADEARAHGMTVCDYYDAEDVKLRNAALTAEGALSIAMQELPIALSEARTAVVGCGRIGNELCRLLRAMGASVTAVARRESSVRYARTLGCSTVLFSEAALRGLTRGYDVVFTTVPSRVFTAEVLCDTEPLVGGRRTLFIDLSSAPGSFDPVAAREYGIRLLWALSLPGKYAPDSAGRVLADRMLVLLSELERAEDVGRREERK